MTKTPLTQTDVYTAPREHPWADWFRDIPMRWERVPDGTGAWVFKAGPGVLTSPTTPSDLARHVQLCGFRRNPADAKVKRIDPVRGGRSLTSPGIWLDATAPEPEGSPVHTVVATAAGQNMTAAELVQAADALRSAAETM